MYDGFSKVKSVHVSISLQKSKIYAFFISFIFYFIFSIRLEEAEAYGREFIFTYESTIRDD